MERAHKIEMQWHDDTNTLGSESSYTTILLYMYNEKWFYTAYTDIINYENLSVTYDKKYFNSLFSYNYYNLIMTL